MTAWVLERDYDDEGDRVYGVYSSKRKAEREERRLMGVEGGHYHITSWEIDTSDGWRV